MQNFSDLGLVKPLLDALVAEGYTTPTPIQLQAIPTVLTGRDLCGIAQTGTGKTAGFALPILQRLSNDPRPRRSRSCRTLVLSPTRELASQIAESFRTYGRNLRLSVTTVFGGVSIGAQERQLSGGVDILVATPGRLIDLIERRALSLGDVEILVLDEADQMLDLGFIHALKRIVKMLPSQRQTLLFSATMPKAIAALAESFLNDPVKVSVAPVATTAERVEQSVIFASSSQKPELLNRLLADPAFERVLVFTRTKHGADKVVRFLTSKGVDSAAIHGNKSQAQRERALAGFKTGRSRVLIATDIAARGIDVDNVSHVINFELPNIAESYVHRIGRTARAGAAGIAISFCNGEERTYLRDIERLTRQAIRVLPTPQDLPAAVIDNTPMATPNRGADSRGRRPDRGGPMSRDGRGEQHGYTRNASNSPRSARTAPRAAAGPRSDGMPAFLRSGSSAGSNSSRRDDRRA